MVSSPRGARSAALAAILCAGCLFPDYTFDEPEPSGAGGAGTGGGVTGASGGGGSDAGGDEGGGGGEVPTEDCFTPGDEDEDGAADCADSDCEPDLECVDSIPVGWGTYGYAALFRGSPAADPACPLGTSMEVYAGSGNLQNADAECSQCGCSAPVGQGCELTDDQFDPTKPGLQPFRTRNSACGAGASDFRTLTLPDPWDFGCSAIDTSAGAQSCISSPCNSSIEALPADVTSGTCTATGGEPQGGEPSWAEASKACRATAGLQGCDAGLTCAPRPRAPYEPRVCIAKAGNVACPAGFPLRSESFADFEDDRACSECTCGGSTGGVCKITMTLYSQAGCGAGSEVVTLESGDCEDLSGNPTIAGRTAAVTTPPTGGSCPVTGGGVPSGEVTPIGPTTFCCLASD